ncbi:class I SAM-dependent methyltransferase [Paenibacillus sp. UNC451MF]|uniref:class I SAM-dependent methyltransferase n=1 Tax=Paenibacillus sp. UNC451MF TaxID=1449063 RepID=UPI000B0D703B|nr:methyltransferase domain-containing protein [Paenibacillus sp. UNC451MF]
MVDDKTKRLSVYLPEKVKIDLEAMANDTGLSMTQLIVIATHGLLSNYKSHGGQIFADLVATTKRSDTLTDKIAASRLEDTRMQDYYGARADEYESIYRRNDPNYQQELSLLRSTLQSLTKDRSVLEIACGTGYWSQFIAESAARLVGVDIRSEVIDIAKAKNLPHGKVTFLEGDAYNLDSIQGSFDFGLANFWFSHIPKNKIEHFLTGFHRKLLPGANVFIADNVYVPGRGGELIIKEQSEDTYKLRELADGSKHEILKNYYDYNELYEMFKPFSTDLKLFVGSSFWYVTYTVV